MAFNINLDNTRQVEGLDELLAEVKAKIEARINLDEYTNNIQPILLNKNTLFRTLILVGLSDKTKRDVAEVDAIKLSSNSARYQHVFNKQQLNDYITLLMKVRYATLDIDLSQPVMLSKALGHEMLRGRDILLKDGLDNWFNFVPSRGGAGGGAIPSLCLNLGNYVGNGLDATIDINTRSVPNTQIVIAGSTGSGKTNLLMNLINQIRSLSTDTAYPVNFLLFDYKGEFSDSKNRAWLDKMEVGATSILDPMHKPLPFNPFRNMEGKTMQEINLEATTLASALMAIFGAKVGANMDLWLKEAICDAYKITKGKPITFAEVLKQYQSKDPERYDTVISSLKSLVDAHMFEPNDDADLMNNSFIINLGQYPKDGSIAKAIVYFTIAKLNSIYDELPIQEKDEERVEIRHFTIIDEAHYMLSFKNRPLQNLIAVGRNKGMSIILATQSMSTFKSETYDFYANAYYPIIMRQQQVDRSIVSGLFGGNQKETAEICQEISNLQLGEMIMKDNEAAALGMGKRYKKIKVTHMI